jgi:hypothetical protein
MRFTPVETTENVSDQSAAMLIRMLEGKEAPRVLEAVHSGLQIPEGYTSEYVTTYNLRSHLNRTPVGNYDGVLAVHDRSSDVRPPYDTMTPTGIEEMYYQFAVNLSLLRDHVQNGGAAVVSVAMTDFGRFGRDAEVEAILNRDNPMLQNAGEAIVHPTTGRLLEIERISRFKIEQIEFGKTPIAPLSSVFNTTLGLAARASQRHKSTAGLVEVGKKIEKRAIRSMTPDSRTHFRRDDLGGKYDVESLPIPQESYIRGILASLSHLVGGTGPADRMILGLRAR